MLGVSVGRLDFNGADRHMEAVDRHINGVVAWGKLAWQLELHLINSEVAIRVVHKLAFCENLVLTEDDGVVRICQTLTHVVMEGIPPLDGELDEVTCFELAWDSNRDRVGGVELSWLDSDKGLRRVRDFDSVDKAIESILSRVGGRRESYADSAIAFVSD